ncbi:YcaO-like family protein [Pseudomonas sp. GM78]|uniref:YcaO-like family protein n=1 Tax=Pseudomonas sp. GM78 TaxID=1144337 RepID=UPI0012F8A913|nr:YcaO-like family protein [Pseudomonas sp. GM78]
MKISTHNYDSSLPGQMWYQPPCTFEFPFCSEISDQWNSIGSGIGTSSTSVKAALGEYFERRHFHLEILPDSYSSLEKKLTPNEVKKFIKAFNQTASKNTNLTCLKSRKLNMISATRISDFSACAIPSVCISLTHDKSEDNKIYPNRDTCGCSFHWNSESAVLGSIKESLERQFLTRFWLTNQYKGIIDANEIPTRIKTLPSYGLFNALKKSGQLLTIDISDEKFPGVCLLTIYGANDPTRNVQYCAGMSYSENRSEALDKSILELWQTFRFMNLFRVLRGNTDSLEDSYIRHFLKCNSYKTFEEISSKIDYALISRNEIQPSKLNIETLIRSLRTQNIEGYLYIKAVKIDNIKYTFCKFISPSLFMHMNNSKNINIDNDYSASFLPAINEDRKEKMVPFP